jgi:endonuclease III
MASPLPLRRSERNKTRTVTIPQECETPPPKRGAPPAPAGRVKRIRSDSLPPGHDKAVALQNRKLKAYVQHSQASPFPDFGRPTPAECRLAHGILARLHGDRVRPTQVVAPSHRAGCGDSGSVLDALVRTILSQNTSDRNSTRAKRSMDREYGGSDQWDAIAAGGQARLQQTIASGGLSRQKSRVILDILTQTKQRYGVYSLDHLFAASDDEAMREMLGFPGVGPKTASCVLLFCLRRSSFAVDTHVYRISGLLGWRPAHNCSREAAQAHLDARVPAEEKYALHLLLVTHGKTCAECRAGGSYKGCELRRAFCDGVWPNEETSHDAEEERRKEEDVTLKREEDAAPKREDEDEPLGAI